jgi:hypothetical protein
MATSARALPAATRAIGHFKVCELNTVRGQKKEKSLVAQVATNSGRISKDCCALSVVICIALGGYASGEKYLR